MFFSLSLSTPPSQYLARGIVTTWPEVWMLLVKPTYVLGYVVEAIATELERK